MKIFAHRGASGLAPENTLSAFKIALNRADLFGIELDVHLTCDNEIVVCHDETLDRTTNLKGEISKLTLQEIREGDAGEWFSDNFKREKIPTLEEVLDLVPPSILLNIEVKDGGGKGIERYLVELLRKKGRVESVLISSFTHRILKRVYELEPNLKIGLLFSADIIGIGRYIDSLDMKVYSYNPEQGFVSKESIADCKERGIEVISWTVNKHTNYLRLKELGVTGVFTNYPDTIDRE